MLINPWITDIRDFVVERSGSLLSINFTAVTPFGKIDVMNNEVIDYV